ncbi:YlbF family regulator [Paenibacillus sp. y28]|uniref:YlbF family regulator n=1 Tax=Paenibacillus sp. y28 TaxID=3129110 RepID=UPI0030186B95
MSEHHHDHDHHDHDSKCAIPQFHISELVIREDIMDKTKELANLISTSAEVEFYKKAESLVTKHQDVQELIKEIKKKQKEIVAFETTFKNPQMVAKIEAELEQLQDQLDSFPVVNQFKQAQDDVNYLLQLIINVIKENVSEKINVSTDAVEAPGASGYGE